MKIIRRYRSHHFALGLGLCAACQATAPSKELVTARDVYTKAQASDAAREEPETLKEAYQALQAAEAAHEKSPRSKTERNYAYLSARKSELAMLSAREAVAREEQARALREEGARPYAEALEETRAELAARQRDLGQAVAAIIISQAQLHQMRAQSANGQVVVSRTGVFFDTGKAELSAEARRQLDILATELLAHPEQETLIQGSADSRGDEEKNLALSRQRAEVVRDYLVSRGVPAEGLRAMGLGDRHPVASNETPTGRASNRRVEIATALASDARENVRGTDADSEGDPETEEPGVEDPETEDPDIDDLDNDDWQGEEPDQGPGEPPLL